MEYTLVVPMKDILVDGSQLAMIVICRLLRVVFSHCIQDDFSGHFIVKIQNEQLQNSIILKFILWERNARFVPPKLRACSAECTCPALPSRLSIPGGGQIDRDGLCAGGHDCPPPLARASRSLCPKLHLLKHLPLGRSVNPSPTFVGCPHMPISSSRPNLLGHVC